jgi:hypothetical protein
MISLPIARRCVNPMSWSFREPTITEMLSDSIVMAVMAADGVDPIALEAQLRGLAKPATAARSAGPLLEAE